MADCGIAEPLVVPGQERQDMIHRFHDSLFAGHLGVSRTIYRLHSFMYSLLGSEVSLSTKGPYGTCGCGAPLG